MINITRHAQERWDERFCCLNLKEEFANATTATKSQKKSISKTCPHDHNKQAVYLVSKSGCMFVIKGDYLITVLPFVESMGKKVKTNHRTVNKRKYR